MTRKPGIRRIARRRWIALGTVAGVAVSASGAIGAQEARIGSPDDAVPDLAAGVAAPVPGGVELAASEGGEGGEADAVRTREGGEGGEGGDAGDETAAYLADLGLVEGHLRAGLALYEAGEAGMAKTHMKHPGDEIYTDLAPELEEHDAPAFADELAALAATIEQGRPAAEARAALAAVIEKLGEARAAAGADAAAELDAIVRLVRTAAEEYAEALDEGKVVEVHEYQDAWGFVHVARARAARLAQAGDERVSAAAGEMLARLDGLAPAFPGIVPPATLDTDPSLLYGTAARMEIAALKAR